LQEEIRPTIGQDSDGDVKRDGARRDCLMQVTARDVDGVAGGQFELQLRLPDTMGRRIEMLIPERQLDGGAVGFPALAAGDLQHEYVVGIVVNSRPLIARWREIDVRLKRVAENRFQSATERR